MKKHFFATAIAVALLASCSAERENPAPQPEADGAKVLINFTTGDATRAFFDDTMEAEPYEKEIKSAMIYVFDSQGAMVMRKQFTAQEISSLSASLILPNSVAGEECTFYALANHANFYQTNLAAESDLLKTYDYAASYNGHFDLVSSGQQKTSGMTMNAVEKAVVQPQGTPTNVSLVLKRTVAKIAVKVSVDEKFASQYAGGKIFVNNVTVSNAPSRMWIFPRTNEGVFPMDYIFTQNSKLIGNDYCNLFYLPETLPSDERIMLHIDAAFDQDGNTYTTDDQIAIGWDIMIEGSGNGEIRRNGYYRISAVIYGFDALKDVRSLITAGEWESPVTPDTISLY